MLFVVRRLSSSPLFFAQALSHALPLLCPTGSYMHCACLSSLLRPRCHTWASSHQGLTPTLSGRHGTPGHAGRYPRYRAAYRTVPVWPPHERFLVVGFDGSFRVNHKFPFGLTTAGGVQGHVANATVDILHAMDMAPIKKWVNDRAMFRFPVARGVLGPDGSISSYEYLFDLLRIFEATRPMGIP